MKGFKVFALVLGILAFSANAMAISSVTKVAAGTTSYGIAFKRMIQSVSIIPYSANISVEFLIGTTQVDSFDVLVSTPMANIPVVCDSINIIRPTSTAVMVIPNYGDKRDLQLGGNALEKTNWDSLLTLTDSIRSVVSKPSPVSIEAAVALINSKDVTAGTGPTHFTSPIGVQVDGAYGLLLHLEWKSLTGYFVVESVFSSAANDTMVTVIVAAADTVKVDSAGVVQSATRECFDLPIPSVGPIFMGFYHVRIWVWDATDIENLTAAIRVGY